MDEFKKLTKKQLIEKLQLALDEKAKLEEKLNQIKYLLADFDNYRKQLEKEKENLINFANEKLISDLLVILDDFERALSQNPNDTGLELLYKKFLKILNDYGLQVVKSLGEKFDPMFHEVLEIQPSDKNDVVIEEIQKGYLLKSKVLRPAKVKISKVLNGEQNGQQN